MSRKVANTLRSLQRLDRIVQRRLNELAEQKDARRTPEFLRAWALANRMAGRTTNSITALQEMMGGGGEVDVDVLVELGLNLQAAGYFAPSAERLQEAWRRAPGDPKICTEIYNSLEAAALRVGPLDAWRATDRLIEFVDEVVSGDHLLDADIFTLHQNFHAATSRIRGEQELGIARDIPPILINAMPNSASTHMLNYLSRGLEIPAMQPTLSGSLPLPIPAACRQFLRGGVICRNHFMLDRRTQSYGPLVDALRAHGLTKMVFHFRDPRQVYLSNIFYVRRAEKTTSEEGWRQALANVSAAGLNDDDRLVAKFGNFYNFVKMIETWVAIADDKNSGFDILLTTFDDFMDDAHAFFNRILAFYGLNAGDHFFAGMDPSAGEHNFRLGKRDEWREVLPPAIRKAMWDVIDGPLAERFGWEA